MIEPIFSCDCDEPQGIVNRKVYPLILDMSTLQTLWHKYKKFRTIFSKEINKDFDKFVALFVSQADDKIISNGLYWIIDDYVGLFYLTDIEQQGEELIDAKVHYVFFDSRHKGRYDITKKMLGYLFDTYKFKRLTVEVPTYASPTVKLFVEKIGFNREGKKYNAIRHNGEYFDSYVFASYAPEDRAKVYKRIEDSKAYSYKYNNAGMTYGKQ